MRLRKLTASGDYQFGGGAADFWQDVPDGVGQAVGTRLALRVGEWFLDTAEGTAWDTQVLGVGTEGLYDMEVRSRILNTQGVIEMAEYASERLSESRALSIQATISTIYGATKFTPSTFVSTPIVQPLLDNPVLLGSDGVELSGPDGQTLLGPPGAPVGVIVPPAPVPLLNEVDAYGVELMFRGLELTFGP